MNPKVGSCEIAVSFSTSHQAQRLVSLKFKLHDLHIQDGRSSVDVVL